MPDSSPSCACRAPTKQGWSGPPSAWVMRHAPLIRPGGTVLDLACGLGRHVRALRGLGHAVVAVDRDTAGLGDLAGDPGVEIHSLDLENGAPWPFAPAAFDAVVVTNYLWRPLLAELVASLAPGGVLIYETFALGNEALRRPRNPDHLLRSGELLALAAGRLQVVAYEHGRVEQPFPAVVQRICAANDLPREGGEPPPHPL